MFNLKKKKQEKPAESKNIFKTPITGRKAIAKKREEHIRSKNLTKGYVYLSVAIVFLAVYSIMFLYPQVSFYLEAPAEIQRLDKEIENFDNVVLPNLEKEKDLHKAAYDEEFKVVEEALEKVFPESIDKFGIVKRLENFATSINTKTPPFEFNSMSFQPPLEEEGYTILPIKTSIHSSTANFDRFLQLVGLSGRLDSDIQVRLMEISNISISYRGVDPTTGEDKGVDFSVTLNTYSR
jgi:hypothetical protein